jgi:hypothetical protein
MVPLVALALALEPAPRSAELVRSPLPMLRTEALASYHTGMADLQNPPMGCLDAFDVGDRKLTVQTEFILRPEWHIETKVYLGGTLKKVYTHDLSSTSEPQLQRAVSEFHKARMVEIENGLRNRKS